MGSALIGAKPRPRILVISPNTELKEEVRDAIGTLAPTVRFIDNTDELETIRGAEWDAAVLFGTKVNISSDIRVIQFGGIFEFPVQTSPNPGRLDYTQVHNYGTSNATEFSIPHNVGRNLSPLINSELIPLIQSEASNKKLTPTDMIRAFVKDGDGEPLAGVIQLPNRAEWWWLPWAPPDSLNYAAWIAAALQEWSTQDGNRFPGGPHWNTQERWKTLKEIELKKQITNHENERERIIRELDEREVLLRLQLEEASQAADKEERRLLLSQGEALVSAVAIALQGLGFDVLDVDKEGATKGDLLEDLQIKDPDDPEWISLAEVRGYTSGAKQNDLLRIGRFVERYIQSTGRVPSARWYIVNHHINEDPSVRPKPLASNPLEVETFSEANGLILDTRTLFELSKNHQTGQISSVEARMSLRGGKGLYEIPPV